MVDVEALHPDHQRAGRTILLAAVLANDVPLVKRLLEADPETIKDRSKLGETALHLAILHGSREMIQVLLERGADINAPQTGQDYYTPLHTAAWLGRESAVQMLLERGADVGARDASGRTPLETARVFRRLRVSALLAQQSHILRIAEQDETDSRRAEEWEDVLGKKEGEKEEYAGPEIVASPLLHRRAGGYAPSPYKKGAEKGEDGGDGEYAFETPPASVSGGSEEERVVLEDWEVGGTERVRERATKVGVGKGMDGVALEPDGSLAVSPVAVDTFYSTMRQARHNRREEKRQRRRAEAAADRGFGSWLPKVAPPPSILLPSSKPHSSSSRPPTKTKMKTKKRRSKSHSYDPPPSLAEDTELQEELARGSEEDRNFFSSILSQEQDEEGDEEGEEESEESESGDEDEDESEEEGEEEEEEEDSEEEGEESEEEGEMEGGSEMSSERYFPRMQVGGDLDEMRELEVEKFRRLHLTASQLDSKEKEAMARRAAATRDSSADWSADFEFGGFSVAKKYDF